MLDYLSPYIRPGTIIVFDEILNFVDFEKHEIRAFYEFVKGLGVSFDILGVECVGVCQHVAIKVTSCSECGL